MNPNDINKPLEQTNLEPTIDTSQLFKKDPEPIFAPPKSKHAVKKKFLLLIVPVVLLLSGGIGFALMNNSDDNTLNENMAQIATEELENADSPTIDTNTDQDAESQTESNDESADSTTENTTSSGDDTTDSTDSDANPPSSDTGGSGESQNDGDTTTSSKTYTIDYTNNCYSPANRTIKQGDTIKFTNSSNKNMWPASDNHPSHTIYPEFDPDTGIAPGSSWSFTFTKTGSWDYHDHNKPGCTGTITVN